MICKQLESHKSHGRQQLALLEQASKLAEDTAHHQQNTERDTWMYPFPTPALPVLQLEQKAAFHTNQEKLSLTKGHSWDSTKQHGLPAWLRQASQKLSRGPMSLLREGWGDYEAGSHQASTTPPRRSPYLWPWPRGWPKARPRAEMQWGPGPGHYKLRWKFLSCTKVGDSPGQGPWSYCWPVWPPA